MTSGSASDDGASTGGGAGPALRFLLALAGCAVAVRFAAYALSWATSMSLSIPNAENWQDFTLAYLPAAQAFKSGLLPYAGFFYPYPPLFLWALTLFSPFPYPSWITALPLVVADALTVVPVYLIAREFAGERVSRLAAALFIVSPANLWYADYLFLNPALTTLFLMTSAYLVIRGRYGWSALALALSIGFKQTALFALPVVLLVVWKKSGLRAEPLRYLLVVAAVCLAFSLPYLAASPSLYIDSMFRLPLPASLPQSYYSAAVGPGTRVTFDTSDWLTSKWALLSNGVYSPVTLALPIFIFLVPPQLLSYYGSLLVSGAGLFFLALGYLLFLVWLRWRPKVDPGEAVRYLLCGMLFVFALYPLYKYYIVGIVPLLVLGVRGRRDALGFMAFSFALLLVPRYFASWVLLASFVWLYRRGLRRLVKLAAGSLVAPFRLTPGSQAAGQDDQGDTGIYWRGRPLSSRSWFGVAALAWLVVLLALVELHTGAGSAGFFLSVAASIVYLAVYGLRGLAANSQNMLWFGMLWGYDIPYAVVFLLNYSGYVRF